MFWHFRITIFKTNYNFSVFLLIDSILKYTGSFVTMFLRWHCFDRCFIATDVCICGEICTFDAFCKIHSVWKNCQNISSNFNCKVEKWDFFGYSIHCGEAVGWFPEIAIQQLYFSFVNLEISLTFRHWWWNTRFLQNKWQ